MSDKKAECMKLWNEYIEVKELAQRITNYKPKTAVELIFINPFIPTIFPIVTTFRKQWFDKCHEEV